MMKKNFVIPAVILVLTAFGTVSSAQAFIDPVSLTLILGVTMIVTVTVAEVMDHEKKECPEKQESASEEKNVAHEVHRKGSAVESFGVYSSGE